MNPPTDKALYEAALEEMKKNELRLQEAVEKVSASRDAVQRLRMVFQIP